MKITDIKNFDGKRKRGFISRVKCFHDNSNLAAFLFATRKEMSEAV